VPASELEELNQSEWEELTAWQAGPLSYGSAWKLLTDPQLPETFRHLVQTLKNPNLRKLQQEADAIPHLGHEPVMTQRKSWNNRFANLVSGRFTEKLFQQTYTHSIEELGLLLEETITEHNWLDFLITQPEEHFRLGINVKNAGVQFWSAAESLGLAPEDTLPIATYKIFGSTAKEGHIPLVYVYLVDWGLLSRLRPAFWSALTEAEQTVFRMMTSFQGIPFKIEDCFIECTVTDRLTNLYTAVGYAEGALVDELPFQAISGLRCQRIFYVNHERAPYVYVRRMNTDPNVHVSVSTETLNFKDFITIWLGSRQSRMSLLEGLGRTEPFPIPNPPM
jgi:hypothetical protein